MKSCTSAHFPVYQADGISLIVSGIGKARVAAAVSYLFAREKEPQFSSWLNVGVGGHASWEIGEARLAAQIKDYGNAKCFYPMFPWKLRHPVASLCTVDKMETAFAENAIYEMEASSFYETALLFSSAELIHVFKVISDNLSTPAHKDPKRTEDLIASRLPEISDLVASMLTALKTAKQVYSNSDFFSSFLAKWHFTETQQYQLKRELERWEAGFGKKNPFDAPLECCKNAKEVLLHLRSQIDTCFS